MNAVSKSNAQRIFDQIEAMLTNDVVVNFLLDDDDILALIKIQEKCRSVPPG